MKCFYIEARNEQNEYVWIKFIFKKYNDLHLSDIIRSINQYLINTFWIGLASAIVGVILAIVLIGFLIIFAGMALVIVRSVMSLINAQKQQPMPNPSSWLI